MPYRTDPRAIFMTVRPSGARTSTGREKSDSSTPYQTVRTDHSQPCAPLCVAAAPKAEAMTPTAGRYHSTLGELTRRPAIPTSILRGSTHSVCRLAALVAWPTGVRALSISGPVDPNRVCPAPSRDCVPFAVCRVHSVLGEVPIFLITPPFELQRIDARWAAF